MEKSKPEEEGTEEKQGQLIWKNQKQLRTGYTTGSCAAAAAKAAAGMLLGQEEILHVSLMTPKGVRLYLEVGYLFKCWN